jgi:hypothetical protein
MWLSLLTLFMAGCGGGGGGTTPGATVTGPAVSGVASKGPIRSGHLAVFEIISSHNPAMARRAAQPLPGLDNVLTDDKGAYSFTLPVSLTKGGVMIEVKDGVYLDEATQVDKHIEIEFPQHMRAAFGNISGAVKRGEKLHLSVTPFTEMAVKELELHDFSDNSIKVATTKIAHALKLDDKGVDLVHTEPFDASQAPPAGATDDRKVYSHALAVYSQFEKDNNTGVTVKTLKQISDDLVAEIEANNGALTQVTNDRITRSELNLRNGGIDNTGITPATPPTVSVAASPTSLAITAVSTITATVKIGTANAPNGTEVKFAIKSGTGALVQVGDNGPGAAQKSVLTTGGVATVNLKSAVAGSIVVTATAGGVAADSPAVTFVTQPTQAIVKVATSGTLPAGKTIGGITATVTYPTTKGLSITAANVAASGAGTNSTLVPNPNTAGQVILGLINATGIQTGEFATLTFSIAAGNFPVAGDFAVATGATIIDTTGAAIPGITVSVLSATVQ